MVSCLTGIVYEGADKRWVRQYSSFTSSCICLFCIVCESKGCYILSRWVIDLYCCPKTHHVPSLLTYTVVLPQILTVKMDNTHEVYFPIGVVFVLKNHEQGFKLNYLWSTFKKCVCSVGIITCGAKSQRWETMRDRLISCWFGLDDNYHLLSVHEPYQFCAHVDVFSETKGKRGPNSPSVSTKSDSTHCTRKKTEVIKDSSSFPLGHPVG